MCNMTKLFWAVGVLPRSAIRESNRRGRIDGMIAYARVLGALDCELAVIPAAMPTLGELGDLFE